ncbi:MAG: hypothetical protein E7C49_19400 [Clostridium sp.]|nr:hypothetical protein [Clostridium sp.]
MSKTRWEQFNSIVENESIDLKEKALLLILFRYINYEKKYADPSRATLKKLTGISDNRTLDKIFDSLINKGLLVRESGKGVRSKYFIKVGGEITLSRKNTPSGEVTPSVGGEITPSVGGEITPQKENKKKIKENIYSDLIKNYPGKKIKSVRDKKLPKILKEYSIEEIERCINRYAEECKGREKKFILNESTFWNGRYVDYLDENFEEVKNPKEKDIGDLMEQLMANRGK